MIKTKDSALALYESEVEIGEIVVYPKASRGFWRNWQMDDLKRI